VAKMYVLIRKDTSTQSTMLHAICVVPNYEIAYRQMLMEVEYFYESCEVIWDEERIKCFKDHTNNVQIEVSIIETIYIDW